MNYKKILIIAGIVLAMFGCLFISYEVGLTIGTATTKNVEVTYKNAENPTEVTADFNVFWDAWSKLKQEHLNSKKVSDQEIVSGAIAGIASAFGDPYTTYFDTSAAKMFSENISGNFGGIGAEIGIRDDQLQVVSPIKGTPAEAMGLKSGDKILEIDGKATTGLSVDESVKKIRGTIGTTVTLTVFRSEWKENKKITLTRANIVVPSVELQMKGDNKDIMYVQLFGFTESTPKAFYDAVTEGAKKGGNAMILDLRGNPGGLLDVAVHLAGYFLPDKTLVVTQEYAETSGQAKVPYYTSGNSALTDIPVVVLINEGSASASEILAGALNIQRKTQLVGKQSFGKGTVQVIEQLVDGSMIKITTSHWVMPNGTTLDGKGILPTKEVAITEKDIEAKKDPQLDAAMELIISEMKSKTN